MVITVNDKEHLYALLSSFLKSFELFGMIVMTSHGPSPVIVSNVKILKAKPILKPINI